MELVPSEFKITTFNCKVGKRLDDISKGETDADKFLVRMRNYATSISSRMLKLWKQICS